MTNTTNAARKIETATCPKCEGRGVLNYHLHIADGRCFQCGGAGTIEIDTSSARVGARKAFTRKQAIDYCAMIVRVARNTGALRHWMGEAREVGIYMPATMAAMRADGFDDVATRCEAAVCAALGCTLPELLAVPR